MKTIVNLIMTFLWVFIVVSCDNAEVMLKTTADLEAAYDVTLSTTDIVLSSANDADTVLKVKWKVKPLELNNADYQLSKTAITTIVQLDTINTFSKATEYTKRDSLDLTGEILNLYAKNMKFEAGVSSKIFVRVKTTSSPNNVAKFSNVLSLMVTPYDAGNDYLYIGLGQDISSLSFTDNNRLCSRNKDGIYDGLLYAASGWLNFRFTPAPNTLSTVYGSEPINTGRFNLWTASDQYGLWLDEETGLYYLKADINTKEWSFNYFKDLYVYGDFNSWNASNTPLIWDATTKTYSATITFSAANSQLKLVPADKTGTSLWSYQFGAGANTGELYLNGDNILNPAAGTFLLTVDLKDPAAYKYTLTTPQ